MWHLLDLLFPPRVDEQRVRELSVDDLLTFLGPRLVEETDPGTVALLSFHEPLVRATIHEAKYHGSPHATTLLAAVLATYLGDLDERAGRIVLVPIPLGSQRRKERGYNQVEATVRRCLKQHPHLPFNTEPEALARTRDTVSQVSLRGDERRENMRGAFRSSRALDPDTLYVVIDDVITTGATLQAAVDALRSGGATRCLPLALAH